MVIREDKNDICSDAKAMLSRDIYETPRSNSFYKYRFNGYNHYYHYQSPSCPSETTIASPPNPFLRVRHSTSNAALLDNPPNRYPRLLPSHRGCHSIELGMIDR